MVRDRLQAASDGLREAAAATDDEDVEGRLYDQSQQMATLATADRGPDQGRLDRHMNTLRHLIEETDGEVKDAIEDALEDVRAYRETVGGV